MKLKTALTLSVIVNAIFVMAVGYMLATDTAPESTTPIVVYANSPPAAQLQSLAASLQK